MAALVIRWADDADATDHKRCRMRGEKGERQPSPLDPTGQVERAPRA
jgi:hypothetical protein